MKPTPLADFYARFAPVADAEPGILPPPGRPGEVGHFNVFDVADLVPGLRHQPLAAFDRRAYYKISLVRGRGQVEYADQVLDIDPTALWFATTHVPYRWVPHDLRQAGYFCLFTDEFLRPAGGGGWTSCRFFGRAATRCWRSRRQRTRRQRPFSRRWRGKSIPPTPISTTCCAPTCWS